MTPHRIIWRFSDSAGPRTHTATLTSYGAAHDLARLLRASPQVTCVVVQEPENDIPSAPVRAEQVRRAMRGNHRQR